jgi:hypothetical protein
MKWKGGKMIEKEILYEKNVCDRCEAHKTDLGLLLDLERVVRENFHQWNKDKQEDLIIAWFEQTKTDDRMKYIEKSKQATTQQIQKYKQSNIKAING